MAEDIYFEVSIELSWGSKESREIGPYSEEALDDYGQPPSEDVERAVWNIIGDRVGVQRK